MKKMIALLMALCLLLGAGALAENAAHSDALVVYFSCMGTTKGVAEKLAKVTGADLYEIVPAGSDFDFGDAESRYSMAVQKVGSQEMLTVSIRAKEPDGDTSKLYEYPVGADIVTTEMDDNMKFAAAVIETGMILRDSEWKGTATYAGALELLRSCGSVAGDSCKEEFVYLVNLLERGN